MVIGFSGGTGAGKSTLVDFASKVLGVNNTLILAQDHYYKHMPNLSFDERCKINFDHPKALDFDLITSDLQKLKNDISIQRPVYSFENHLRKSETVLCEPKKYILVEGILVFAHHPLVEQFDFKVYIEAAKDIRVQRRIARDIAFRGRTQNEVKERFKTTLHAMHEQFIAPYKQNSDLIILNNNKIERAKSQLGNWLKTIIR